MNMKWRLSRGGGSGGWQKGGSSTSGRDVTVRLEKWSKNMEAESVRTRSGGDIRFRNVCCHWGEWGIEYKCLFTFCYLSGTILVTGYIAKQKRKKTLP